MKLKKTIASLALAGLAACTLAACTSGGGGSTVDNYTLKVYAPIGDTLLGFLQAGADRFTAENPDWTVEFTTTTFSGSYDNVKSQVITDLNVNDQPAIAYCYPDHVAQYLQTGKVLNLNNFIHNSEYGYTDEEWKDFVPAYVSEGEAFSVEGRYTIPMARSTEVMFINKTALAEAGLSVRDSYTWDQLWADCQTLKNKYKKSTPLGYDSAGNWFISYLEDQGAVSGAKLYTDGSKTGEGKILFNNDTFKGYLKNLHAKYSAGLFTTKDISSTNSSNNFKTWKKATANDFEGHFFSIGSTGGSKYQLPELDSATNTPNFEVEVRAIPSVDGHTKCISQGPSMVLLDQGSEEKNIAAWKLCKEFLSVDTQINYSAKSGYSPVRFSVLTNPTYLGLLEQGDVEREQALINKVLLFANTLTTNLYTSDVFVGSDIAREQMGVIMKEVMTSKNSNIDSVISTTVSDAFSEVAFYLVD